GHVGPAGRHSRRHPRPLRQTAQAQPAGGRGVHRHCPAHTPPLRTHGSSGRMSNVNDLGQYTAKRAGTSFRFGDWTASVVPPLLSALFVLALWEGFVRLNNVPAYLLPAPSLILSVMIERFELLMRQLGYTALASALGFT